MLELTKTEVKPTFDDAGLYLRLMELLSDEKTSETILLILKGKAGRLWEEEKGRVLKVLALLDAAGALFKSELLHEDLLLSTVPVLRLWENLKPVVDKLREETGIPSLYSSFEEMANSAQKRGKRRR
ncbi:hypothetical protein DRP77_06500 [Candidatus Poribacteria bacterium]|nr:MAG: hypothetical protein DRP77_06500 [Candidatus Poribacteria bacterium]